MDSTRATYAGGGVDDLRSEAPLMQFTVTSEMMMPMMNRRVNPSCAIYDAGVANMTTPPVIRRTSAGAAHTTWMNNLVLSPFDDLRMSGGMIWPDSENRADRADRGASCVRDHFMHHTRRILGNNYAVTGDTDLSSEDIDDGAAAVAYDYDWDQNEWMNTPVGQWYGINGTMGNYVLHALPGIQSNFTLWSRRVSLGTEEQLMLLEDIYSILRSRDRNPLSGKRLENGRNVVRSLWRVGASRNRDSSGKVDAAYTE
jgi:hypothetical protein